jgi:formylmethanofuran--tetrahydromethanopterin N-formyltransferase
MEINGVLIEDTYAEAFPAWISLIAVTAASKHLAYHAAMEATGFATSVIGCAAEAGIDCYLPPNKSPDDRPGYMIMIAHPSKKQLKEQLIERLAECVLTAPTAAAYNGMPEAEEKLPVKLHFFGDGYEYQKKVMDRNVWAIPVMGGEFIIEEDIGCVKGVAGGNFLVMGSNQMAALTGAQAAIEVIDEIGGASTSFPGGIVGAGSKVGSKKYKFMKASTNDAYCPTLRGKVADSKVPDGVQAVFEIVIDGVSEKAVAAAMREGILAACRIPGVTHITAGNYGGTLGPYKFELHKILS